jgi:flagellar motor switch protein FliG
VRACQSAARSVWQTGSLSASLCRLRERHGHRTAAVKNGMNNKNMSKSLPTTRDDNAPLSAVDKVTALLLTMSKPSADVIIKKLDNQEIRLVGHSVSALPPVPEEVIEQIIDELYAALDTPDTLVGSASGVQQLFSGVVSEDQISDIIAEVSGTTAERVWVRLSDVKDERIAEFLAGEQPQVATVVLSRLDASKAASVMEKLSSAQRADLSRRLLTLRPTTDAAMQLIAERLREVLFAEIETTSEENKHAKLAAILNKLDRDQIEEILTSIGEDDPAEAERVKNYVFTFDDIAGMDVEDRARLMDEVPAERVVLALRDADPVLIDLILQTLSPRSRRIVEAELATEARVAPQAISEARRWIAVLALSLAERSLIKLRPEAAPPEA